MILKMYSVYDMKAQIYHPPYYCHNTGHATRMFTTIFSDPKSTINMYPEDFQVWELGEFDDSTAKIKPLPNSTLVCTAADLITTNFQKPEVKNETTRDS